MLVVYLTGRSDVFFWVTNLQPRYFFGSRNMSRIFRGPKVCSIELVSIEVLSRASFG